MDCPYCNKEMKAGLIEGSGRAPFRWIDSSKTTGILDKLENKLDKSTILVENHYGSLKKNYLKGYRCESCGKIIIDI